MNSVHNKPGFSHKESWSNFIKRLSRGNDNESLKPALSKGQDQKHNYAINLNEELRAGKTARFVTMLRQCGVAGDHYMD